MKPKDNIEQFARDASIGTDPAQDKQVLSQMREAYAHATPASRRPDYWGLIFESRVARLAAAAVIFLALGTLVGQLGGMLAGGSVAWADVTQRFQSVPFFYTSIYVKDYALAEPRQFELWMGAGGRARMRVGSQVIFGRDGRVTHAYDIWQRCEVQADETAAGIVSLLAIPDEFSLDTVIQSISAGKLTDVTPTANTQAAIGEDLMVFDAQSAISPGWVRIYALRESRLPVSLRIWNPEQGFSVDASITYAKEQPEVFFNPEAFAEKLAEKDQNNINLAYLFLKDPGGQIITPTDLRSRDQ